MTILMFLVGLLLGNKDYTIVHPHKKHHAIIKISREDNYMCTAFVISDKIALTASHCIKTSQYDIDHIYKEKIKEIEKEQQRILVLISQLQASPCFDAQCILAIQTGERSLQMLEEYKTKLLNTTVSTVSVSNSKGEDTKIKAKASYKSDMVEDGRDFAILEGDFKDFEKIPVYLKDFNVENGDKLRSCGYAGGTTPPGCTTLIAIGNNGFQYIARGYLVKGMSGGPVIDENGVAVGINHGVNDNSVEFTPIIGVLSSK